MSGARFIEKVSVEQARKYVQEGRAPYQFLTADPSVLPIFGPAYDDHCSGNVARKEGRLVDTIEQAQAVAKRFRTTVSEVFFLTGAR